MAEFYVKQGDVGRLIETQLLDATNTPINLTGATVAFHMRRDQDASAKVSAAATVVSAASGTVSYTWTGTDTDTAGVYKADWRVTLSGGATLTVPTHLYDTVYVDAKLA